MKEESCSGKLIVFEGIDGSGKSTQANLLIDTLKRGGQNVAQIDFPQYRQKSAGLIEEYLNGEYGTSKEVGPYRAAILFACDRYDASFKVKEWLNQGKIVISDRYMASNIGHQAGKISSLKERKKFIKWVYDLEYNIFEIPKPDLYFFLKVPPTIAYQLSGDIKDPEKRKKKRIYLGKEIRDIHEKDICHLEDSFDSYMLATTEFTQDFKTIECLDNNELLSPKVIHEKIWKIIKQII